MHLGAGEPVCAMSTISFYIPFNITIQKTIAKIYLVRQSTLKWMSYKLI